MLEYHPDKPAVKKQDPTLLAVWNKRFLPCKTLNLFLKKLNWKRYL